MTDLFSWVFEGGFSQTIRPDVIWMFSTGNLLPYCIIALIIIFLTVLVISKKFFIKKSLSFKDCVVTVIITLVVYYLLWAIVFNIFALSAGIVSRNL